MRTIHHTKWGSRPILLILRCFLYGLSHTHHYQHLEHKGTLPQKKLYTIRIDINPVKATVYTLLKKIQGNYNYV